MFVTFVAQGTAEGPGREPELSGVDDQEGGDKDPREIAWDNEYWPTIDPTYSDCPNCSIENPGRICD